MTHNHPALPWRRPEQLPQLVRSFDLPFKQELFR